MNPVLERQSTFDELLHELHDKQDYVARYAKRLRYFRGFKRAFAENYLNGNVACILNFVCKGERDCGMTSQLPAPRFNRARIVMQLQPSNVPIIGCGNENPMFVRNVHIVKAENRRIPSLVRLYFKNNKVIQSGTQPVYLDSMESRFKFFDGAVYGKLGTTADCARGQFADDFHPRVVERGFEVMDCISNDQCNVGDISKFMEPIVNGLDSGIGININPSGLTVWASDDINAFFGIQDILIGPLNL